MDHFRNVLRPVEAADYLKKSISTLARWRVSGAGPPFVKLGPKAVGYRVNDIDDWLKSNVKRSTSE